ncbi:flagellar basal body-associated protein FliL [Desulfitobacterium hafniense]|uniref:Flagellar protein FliL n=1 Tax=Desulfitobacterium hafniense TaxID=49338 RepID=A0A0W1JJS9_DESHA|nr:flagellar basal body-associated FliL family protein [Desulfitobacterium hafniense]KTE91988.1 flagellar basal body-associated protein FliL [Desulfitobacterium hafniense]
MDRKLIIAIFLAGFLGSTIGVVGTLSAQKLFFSDSPPGQEVIKKEEGPVISVGEFTVNLQGGAFLKASIALEGMNEKSEAAITAKDAFIKDRINTVLSSKSLKDMQPEVREDLKHELITQLNEVTGNQVQSIFFLSFVYQ